MLGGGEDLKQCFSLVLLLLLLSTKHCGMSHTDVRGNVFC